MLVSQIFFFLVPNPVDPKRASDILRKYDRNGDGRIGPEDIEAFLRDLGVGMISKRLYSTLSSHSLLTE